MTQVLFERENAFGTAAVAEEGGEIRRGSLDVAVDDHCATKTQLKGELPPSSSRQLTVLHLIDRLVIAGATDYALSLASQLDETKFSGYLITGVPSVGESDRIFAAVEAGVTPFVIGDLKREIGFHDVRAFVKIVSALFALKPDVVHTHKSKAGTLGRLAVMVYNWATPTALWLRPRRCRTVHTFHGHVFHNYFSPLKTRMFLAIERLLGKWGTDCVITISPQQRKDITEVYRIARAEKVVVIPVAVEINEGVIRPGAFRSQYGIGPGEFVIGTVGRLCEIKNFPLMLRAFAKARREMSNDGKKLRLVIVGDGHVRGELEALAKTLEIGDAVIFAGFRDDAAALYCDFDLVALSSLNEGTPIALIEAMLHSRPVLATSVGGTCDLMGEPATVVGDASVWEHGVTVPSNDVDAFAEAIRLLVTDSKLRERLGKAGRQFAQANFSKRKLLTEVANLYETLTASSAAPLLRKFARKRPNGGSVTKPAA